jgi:hypothetical protein
VFFDYRLIEADCVLVFIVVLHEKHMRNIKTPAVMITAKFNGFPKDFLNRRIMLHFPIDARLCH